jgi:hypothetical protein
MTELALPGVSYVEAHWGMWIARCIRPWCTNAMQVDLHQPSMVCEGADGCGQGADLFWPADPEAIAEILMMRPIRRTRNWLPGESITDLIGENVQHGVVPPEWYRLSAAAGGVLALAHVVEERLVGGILHAELVAAGRREIGA